jgi:hypothetical protein
MADFFLLEAVQNPLFRFLLDFPQHGALSFAAIQIAFILMKRFLRLGRQGLRRAPWLHVVGQTYGLSDWRDRCRRGGAGEWQSIDEGNRTEIHANGRKESGAPTCIS